MQKKPDPGELGAPLATFLLMTHTGRHMNHHLGTVGGYGELTPSQFYTLLVLDNNESMPISEISDKIRRSPGNMTLVIDNLEKEGLVERQRSKEDRRVVVAVLTPAGKEKIIAAKQAHRQTVESIFEVLEPQELDSLYATLSKLSDAIGDIPADN